MPYLPRQHSRRIYGEHNFRTWRFDFVYTEGAGGGGDSVLFWTMDAGIKHAKMEISMMKGWGGKPKFVAWAEGKWETFDRTAPSLTPGQAGRCYGNAYAMAIADDDLEMYVGYGVKESLPMAFAHAWTVDSSDNVHDCTPNWGDEAPVRYYGVKIPKKMASLIYKSSTPEYGPSRINDYFADIEWALNKGSGRLEAAFVDLCTPTV